MKEMSESIHPIWNKKHADTIGWSATLDLKGKLFLQCISDSTLQGIVPLKTQHIYCVLVDLCLKMNQFRIGLCSEMIDDSFEKPKVGLGVFGYLVGLFWDFEEESKE